jgi:hypothetical protein
MHTYQTNMLGAFEEKMFAFKNYLLNSVSMGK